MISFLKKTISGLTKTRRKISSLFQGFAGKSYLDESDIEYLEEALLGADLGWELTDLLLDEMKDPQKKNLSLEDSFRNTVNQYLDGITEQKELQKVL